ncbi:hypothetical protein ES288_D10G291800v1 [Gossypium darwinii]|uniref:Uncharacterized protein n=1 Tax=Gossypium darwinii TaxID=34276 RepID=A0A5D2B376_GOSDA|nr:hypothetical protein ES288_D10G291800v1 [Gossypium darwinii]
MPIISFQAKLVTSPELRTQTNETLFLCFFFVLHHFLYLFKDLSVDCRQPLLDQEAAAASFNRILVEQPFVNITFDLFTVSFSCINKMLHSVPSIFQPISSVLEGLNIFLMIGKVFDIVFVRIDRILYSFNDNRANDGNNNLH